MRPCGAAGDFFAYRPDFAPGEPERYVPVIERAKPSYLEDT